MTSPETIITAFHDGGASRISGAFSVHTSPEIMSYFGICNGYIESKNSITIGSN